MAQLIDKFAVMAEIERIIADNKKDIERASHKNLEDYFEGYEDALVLFKEKFLDTLEVKEVDLDKELDSMITPELKFHKALPSLFDVAKHFFELGLKTQKGE